MIDPDALLTQSRYEPNALAAAMLDRYYAPLHFLAYSILGDADEADDAVQETLLRALDQIDRYRPGSNMKAWLSRIVVNHCRDRLRRRGVRQRLQNGLERIIRLTPNRESVERGRLQAESRATLWSLVNALGEKHRLPLILRYVHELSIVEIAALLEVREGTVHSRLHYACRKLEQQLVLTDQAALVEELFDV